MSSNESLLRTALLVLLVLLFLPFVFMLVMMPFMGLFGWTHMGGTWMGDGTGGWFGWLFVVIVPLLVVLGLGYAVYSLTTSGTTGRRDSAMEELRLAYARGDLTDEEFENRRQRLEREE